jgi:hypothetical protein
LPVDIEHLRALYRRFSKAAGSPATPSRADKELLEELEALKVVDPLYPVYQAAQRQPLVCGTPPERTVVEVRMKDASTALTYWYYWSYDLFPGDHPDWEPLTLVYSGGALATVFGRVHDGLVEFTPDPSRPNPVVFFFSMGHTPVVKVRDERRDVRMSLVADAQYDVRARWLALCYSRANGIGWTINDQQGQLQAAGGPVLDTTRWGAWGKHSVYLRI